MTQRKASRKDIDSDEDTVAGNRLRLLPDGPAARPALLEAVAAAKTSIRMFYYTFSGDGIGTELRDALIDARTRGVRVDLAIDDFGSSDTPKGFFDPLVEAGAEFCRFHPRYGRRYLLRNHQKMAIFDEQRALIGGFNIADAYFDKERADSWRDLGLIIDGPAVAHLVGYFDKLFAWIKQPKSRVRELWRMLPRLTQHEGDVRWIFGGPSRRVSPYAAQVRADFLKVSRLEMMMAYFAPNRRFVRLIGAVGKRGTVRLINAGKTDIALSRAAAWSTYGRLLRRKVHIAEFQPRALHAKLIIADDAVYIGSGNFDMRSLYLNLEVMLRIEDATFADRMRALFEREWGKSDEVEPAAYRKLATRWNRFRWRFAYWVFASLDFAMARSLTSRS